MPDSNQWSIRSEIMDAGRLQTLRDREVVKLRESGDVAAGRIKELEEKLHFVTAPPPPTSGDDRSVMGEGT